MYGLHERQFRGLFEGAAKREGVTGANLLISLERRFDNIVFRLGFASSRNQARQVVRHRHFEVNGRVVDVPSFRVSPGDEIALRGGSSDLASIQVSLEARTRPTLPDWLALDEKGRVGRMIRTPTREDIPMAVQEQLIVELYSK
jgi:small subunit ribosomal protein S4